MANALAHKVEVEDGATVETASQLRDVLADFTGGYDHDDELEKSYRVERIAEHLSDGSVVYSLRIREAEPV